MRHDEKLCAFFCERLAGAGDPHILANHQAKFDAFKFCYGWKISARCKTARFIKDAIVGQPHLMANRFDLAVRQQKMQHYKARVRHLPFPARANR